MRKPIKLILFNVAFICITPLCFSDKFLGLGFNPSNGAFKFALSISLAVFGIFMFFFGNYMIILSKDKINYKVDRLETIDDCIGALWQCIRTDPSFKAEITKAIEQLKVLQRRNDSLKALLEQNGITESFKYLNQTANKAEFFAFSNVKSIINRLIVFDNKEYLSNPDSVDISVHRDFINEKLNSNQTILKEYSDLLLALSAIGDTHHMNIDEIRDMTEALNKVLKRDEFKPLESSYHETQEQNNNQ